MNILTFGFIILFEFLGYYMTATDDYDIKWTMPQCVLTLRLIGLAFDLWDGSQPEVSNTRVTVCKFYITYNYLFYFIVE